MRSSGAKVKRSSGHDARKNVSLEETTNDETKEQEAKSYYYYGDDYYSMSYPMSYYLSYSLSYSMSYYMSYSMSMGTDEEEKTESDSRSIPDIGGQSEGVAVY